MAWLVVTKKPWPEIARSVRRAGLGQLALLVDQLLVGGDDAAGELACESLVGVGDQALEVGLALCL